MSWQPIETAPKGTRILLLRGERVVCGRYNHEKYANRPEPYWSHDLERLNGTRDAKAYPPTHWMPLPATPSEA